MNQEDIFKLLLSEAKKISEKQQTPTGYHLLTGIKLKCPGGKDALTYCLSCSNCSVACIDQECHSCFRAHLKCQRMKKIKQFHYEIEETVQPSFILGQIQQNINAIQNMVTDMHKQIKENFKTFKLTQADRQIVNKIRNYHQNQGNINSTDFIRHHEEKQKQKQTWFEQQTQKFQSILENTKKTVIKKFQQIHKAIYYEHLENSSVFQERIFKESRILENKAWKNQMLLLLKDLKPIKQVKRLYCASTDAFLAQSFHTLCDNKPNILYIVRNQFDKTYGGFSPCPISQTRGEQFQADKSMSSFIFSLDLHAKSTLVSQQFSIRNSYKSSHKSNILISFGNSTSPNLVISQNSFAHSRDNWINMYGGAYEQNIDNMEELIGTTEHLICKLKQFEVFQVVFTHDQSEFINGDAEIETQKCQKNSFQQMSLEKKQNVSQKIFQQSLNLEKQKQVQKEEVKQKRKSGRAKKLAEPIPNPPPQKTKRVRKQSKPAKKTKEQQQQNFQAEEIQKPIRKKGRPKKNKPQDQDEQYMCENENGLGENQDQADSDEQEEQQKVGNAFLHQLFGMPHDRLNQLGFLFGGNNQEQSDSHQGRCHGRHHDHHGPHGRKHWKRHHHW